MAIRKIIKFSDIAEINIGIGREFIKSVCEYLSNSDDMNDILEFEYALSKPYTNTCAMGIKHKRTNTVSQWSLTSNVMVNFHAYMTDGTNLRINGIGNYDLTARTLSESTGNELSPLAFQNLAMIYSRNDYDECMITFYDKSRTDFYTSVIYAECCDGTFETLGCSPNGVLFYTYRNTNFASYVPSASLNLENDTNKYLIPFYTPYNVFKRLYSSINIIQMPNVPYAIGESRFVETGVAGKIGISMLYS